MASFCAEDAPKISLHGQALTVWGITQNTFCKLLIEKIRPYTNYVLSFWVKKYPYSILVFKVAFYCIHLVLTFPSCQRHQPSSGFPKFVETPDTLPNSATHGSVMFNHRPYPHLHLSISNNIFPSSDLMTENTYLANQTVISPLFYF